MYPRLRCAVVRRHDRHGSGDGHHGPLDAPGRTDVARELSSMQAVASVPPRRRVASSRRMRERTTAPLARHGGELLGWQFVGMVPRGLSLRSSRRKLVLRLRLALRRARQRRQALALRAHVRPQPARRRHLAPERQERCELPRLEPLSERHRNRRRARVALECVELRVLHLASRQCHGPKVRRHTMTQCPLRHDDARTLVLVVRRALDLESAQGAVCRRLPR